MIALTRLRGLRLVVGDGNQGLVQLPVYTEHGQSFRRLRGGTLTRTSLSFIDQPLSSNSCVP